MSEARGPLLASHAPGCSGCLAAMLGLGGGGMFLAIALAPQAGGAAVVEDMATRVAMGVIGVLVLVMGVGAALRMAGQRVLIFENGFIYRDWRGRERFVPWERLQAIDLRPGLLAGLTVWLQWATVVLVIAPEEEGGRPLELSMGGEGVGLLASKEPSPLVRDLADRAGLQRLPRGCLALGGETWVRPGGGGHAD